MSWYDTIIVQLLLRRVKISFKQYFAHLLIANLHIMTNHDIHFCAQDI